MVVPSGHPEPLEAEARRFAAYLLGPRARPLPEALAQRYAAAVRAHSIADPSEADRAVLDLAAARPWTLGPLDAAAALWARDSALHQRLLLLTAVLEASPEYAEAFLPAPTSPIGLLRTVAGVSLRAAFSAPLGTALHRWVRRRR
jgi:hypothetical protein